MSIATESAMQRRSSAKSELRIQWFLDNVSNKVAISMRDRVRIATQHILSQTVRNISVPVKKELRNSIRGQKTVVTERSKRGEFPRADTTQLMKSIFDDYREIAPGVFEGYVGFPQDYGLKLELVLERQFLTRTLSENLETIKTILSGPLKW